MKVVLFCGGLGTRIRDYSESVPKPMVRLGHRPLLWHVMRYYAHFGHKDFILCLGYKGDVIREYFLNYNECLSNDFTLSEGGRKVELLRRDIEDWRITFVDTGIQSSIGERLLAVRSYLKGEEAFLANYSDGLTDFPLPKIIDDFHRSQATASFLSVRPNSSFHRVLRDADNVVESIEDIASGSIWVNGGGFVFRNEIFDFIRPGEELVIECFQRLIEQRKLITYPYEGFWRGVDTFKDLQVVENWIARGNPPWEVWRAPRSEPAFRPAEEAAVLNIPVPRPGRGEGAPDVSRAIG